MKRAIIIACFYQNISTSRPKLVADFLSTYYETTVLTADFVHSTKSYDNTNIDNVIKVHVSGYKKNFSVTRIWSHIVYACRVTKFIKKNKPELLYVCLPPNVAAWCSIRLSKKLGLKSIVDVVDIWPNYNSSQQGLKQIINHIWGSFRDRALKSADAIILECNLYANYLQQNNKKTVVIPLAKKENTIFNTGKFGDVKSKTLFVAYLGAFSHSYDFDSLVEILRQLKEWKPHMEIIGAGERKPYVLKVLEQAGILYTDYGVIYDDAHKANILSKCQLGYNGFVKAAVVGQSYKSVDYLSLGIPLLNSLRADTWELVQSKGVGFNFNPDELSEVASNIDRYSSEDFQQMKKRARLVFEELYSWDVYCDNMKKVLEEIGELV